MSMGRINRVDPGGRLLAPRDFTLPDNGSRLAVVFRLLHRFHIEFGAISVVATVYIVLRMETLDHESHPVHLTWSVFSYIPWLILEIIKANLDVAKRVILRFEH